MSDLIVQVGPIGWSLQRYKEECRLGVTAITTYVTIGCFHIFYSRPQAAAKEE